MRAGRRIVGRGTGADVLGHPLEALRWLANNPPTPEGLQAGEIVSVSLAEAVGTLKTVDPDLYDVARVFFAG